MLSGALERVGVPKTEGAVHAFRAPGPAITRTCADCIRDRLDSTSAIGATGGAAAPIATAATATIAIAAATLASTTASASTDACATRATPSADSIDALTVATAEPCTCHAVAHPSASSTNISTARSNDHGGGSWRPKAPAGPASMWGSD